MGGLHRTAVAMSTIFHSSRWNRCKQDEAAHCRVYISYIDLSMLRVVF